MPSQRLGDGGLAVAVADVPALGSASLRVGRARLATEVTATAAGAMLESPPSAWSWIHDSAIRSLIDRVRC